jgi:hypothetical protein
MAALAQVIALIPMAALTQITALNSNDFIR